MTLDASTGDVERAAETLRAEVRYRHGPSQGAVATVLAELALRAARIDALTAKLKDRHSDRWHATRDAALIGLLSAAYEGNSLGFEAQAAAIADRAHGPLESGK